MIDAVWLINTQLPNMSGLELYHMLHWRLERGCVFFVSNPYSVNGARRRTWSSRWS